MIRKNRQEVFSYMAGVLLNNKCKPYIINGVDDHLHILTHIHQTVPVANLVKDIKISSHKFIDEKGLFPAFTNWQVGYAAFTYAKEAVPNLFRYIENQEEHHYGISFRDEYVGLLEEHGIEYEEKYLFE